MAKLGTLAANAASQTTTLKPSVTLYDDLLVVNAADLPNGVGRPYAVVVVGNVGNFTQDNWQVSSITRFGLRVTIGSQSVELPETWSTISRRNSLLSQGLRFGIPFQICAWLPTWNAGMSLRLSGHQIAVGGTINAANAVFDGLVMMVIDAQAMGGSPTLTGWNGARMRVTQRTTPLNIGPSSVVLLNSLNELPWSSGTQEWFIAWSERVHLKDSRSAANALLPTIIAAGVSPSPNYTKRVTARPQNPDVGTNGNLDGSQIQTMGWWMVQEVDSATDRWDCLGTSTNQASYSIGAHNCMVAFRVDNLDGFLYTTPETAVIAQGFGNARGLATVEYSAPTPTNRDLPRFLSLASREPAGVEPRAQGVDGAQNGRLNLSRDPARQLYIYSRTGAASGLESYPVQSALVTPASYPVMGAASSRYDWHQSPEIPQHIEAFVGAREVQFLGFSLSDDGPIEDPPDPVYSDVQIHPGYELPNFAALPQFLHEPEPSIPVDAPDWHEMRAADLSLFMWGAHTTPGRVYPLQWTLSRADARTLLADLEAKRTFRWTPKLEFPATEIAVLVSAPRLVSAPESHVAVVQASGVQLVYFLAP